MVRLGKPLRIAQVTGLISTKYGGFERFMVAMAQACQTRGHQLSCIWEEAPTIAQVAADLNAAGATSLIMPAVGHNAAFFLRLARWMHDTGIDVVHTHFNPASTLALTAARLVQVPLPLAMMHSSPLPQGGATLGRKSMFVARLRRSFTARIFAVSEAITGQLGQLGLAGRAPRTHYLGVPAPAVGKPRAEKRRELGLRDDDFVVSCVAFHDPIKGVDVLLRAVGLLAARVPQLRVIEIGGLLDPAPTAALKRLAVEVGAGDRILWAGWRNDVSEIMQCSDVYCQPSRSEGLPLSVIEAMRAGLPVVATRVGGVHEAVADGETGFLVARESPEPLAAALERLACDRDLGREMGRRGRLRAADRFDLELQVTRLLDSYEQMAATIAG